MSGRRARQTIDDRTNDDRTSDDKIIDDRAVEWPTVVVLVGFYAAWLGVVLGHERIPWPVQFVALVYLGGLSLSLGHEFLHGHPTRWNIVNNTIGYVPLSLWIPFGRYKASHTQHHKSNLTDPFDDPESTYFAPPMWLGARGWKRRYMLLLRTTPGRFTFGVPRTVLRYWSKDVTNLRDPAVRNPWLIHLVLVALFGWWLFGVVGFSPWVYVFGFVLGGVACSALRSFVEHCAVPAGTRSLAVHCHCAPPRTVKHVRR